MKLGKSKEENAIIFDEITAKLEAFNIKKHGKEEWERVKENRAKQPKINRGL